MTSHSEPARAGTFAVLLGRLPAVVAATVLAALLAGCVPGSGPAMVTPVPGPNGGADPVAEAPDGEPVVPAEWRQEGEASWYGPNFAGRTTANGETFDPSRLTAAHRTLPFGARVRVTNLRNGRSVIVRINDRGPFARGRVIDLSRAAAEAVGMIGSGVAPVRVEPADLAGPRRLRSDDRLGGYDVMVPGFAAGRLLVLRNELGSEVLVRTVDLEPNGAEDPTGTDVWASAGLAERFGDRATIVLD